MPLKEEALADGEVVALARRVHLHVDPALDAMFSEAVPARLEVTTTQGRVSRSVMTPKGEAANPLTRADLKAKFAIATESLVDDRRASSLMAAIEKLEEGDDQPLLSALAVPLASGGSPQVAGSAARNA